MRKLLTALARGKLRRAAGIKWWTPYWFHIPRTMRSFVSAFGARSVVRVSVISVIAGVALVLWLRIAMPAIRLPPVWQMLLALPAIYAYLAVMLFVHALIPSRVEVRKDRVLIVTGQSHWIVKSESIRQTRIVIFAIDRIRLRIVYIHQDKLRSRVIGVMRKVNLDVLSETLPVHPNIWDARERYKRLKASSA